MPTREPDETPPAPSTAPTEPSAPAKRTRRRPATEVMGGASGVPLERSSNGMSLVAPGGSPEASQAAETDIDEDGSWIEADAVEVRQGAVGRVDATEVTVSQGAIGAARGERIEVTMGAVGAALGGHVTVSQGIATTVLAQDAHVEQAFVRTLIARDVTFGRPSGVIFLVAQRVSGDVRVLLDWRGAIAFGAAFGVFAGLLGRGRGRGRGRG